MNWRAISLTVGVASLIGGLASFTYGGPSWAGWTGVLFGAAATILGLVPDQLLTIFKIPELRKKIFITLIFLAVYRIGYYVPLPMIDQQKMAEKMAQAQSGALVRCLGSSRYSPVVTSVRLVSSRSASCRTSPRPSSSNCFRVGWCRHWKSCGKKVRPDERKSTNSPAISPCRFA
jgi:hypothetical protein